jgi:hypothetical protein
MNYWEYGVFNMERNTTSGFSTSDLGLAAFLISNESKLRGVDRTNPRRAIFLFETTSPELISGWQSGRGLVSGLAYYNALQTLKGELYRRES